jgi:hypothetical protein
MSSGDELKTREQLIYLLSLAADLEHSLTCQYLFAAFSLKQSAGEGVTEAQLDQIDLVPGRRRFIWAGCRTF